MTDWLSSLQRLFGMPMDRSTKATLWIAFLVLFSYFVWFFADCAIDDSCHLVCQAHGSFRGGCHTQRTPDLKRP
jgi:hypothetical protein